MMPLNLLFTFIVVLLLGGIAFGPIWGLGLGLGACMIVLYWDKIANTIQTEIDKWRG